jgi:hypothetical protein
MFFVRVVVGEPFTGRANVNVLIRDLAMLQPFPSQAVFVNQATRVVPIVFPVAVHAAARGAYPEWPRQGRLHLALTGVSPCQPSRARARPQLPSSDYCLEPGSTFLLVVLSGADSEGFAAITGPFEFAAVNIEILHSVEAASRRTTEARVGDGASGPGSQGAFRPQVSDRPLHSRSNASRFWIMFLLSSGAFEHGMIETADRAGFPPSPL